MERLLTAKLLPLGLSDAEWPKWVESESYS